MAKLTPSIVHFGWYDLEFVSDHVINNQVVVQVRMININRRHPAYFRMITKTLARLGKEALIRRLRSAG